MIIVTGVWTAIFKEYQLSEFRNLYGHYLHFIDQGRRSQRFCMRNTSHCRGVHFRQNFPPIERTYIFWITVNLTFKWAMPQKSKLVLPQTKSFRKCYTRSGAIQFRMLCLWNTTFEFDLCGITRVKVGFIVLQTIKVRPIVGNFSEMATLTIKDNYRKMSAKLTHLSVWWNSCKAAFAPGS